MLGIAMYPRTRNRDSDFCLAGVQYHMTPQEDIGLYVRFYSAGVKDARTCVQVRLFDSKQWRGNQPRRGVRNDHNSERVDEVDAALDVEQLWALCTPTALRTLRLTATVEPICAQTTI